MSTSTAALLDLGSDLALRHRYFSAASLAHPAKLHLGLLRWIVDRYTAPGDTLLDPMAGIGSLLYAALLQRNVILREIEPRWLALCHENAAIVLREAGLFAGTIDIDQADARQPWHTADHIIFSPPYANEFASAPCAKGMLPHQVRQRLTGVPHHRLWDQYLSRATDTTYLQPGTHGMMMGHYGSHPAQLGHLRGDRYWAAMEQVYREAYAALRGGVMVLIIKDHIRRGRRVCVADETVARCEQIGFRLVERHARRVYPLSLWQRRRRERGLPVVEEEDVLCLRKH